MSSSFGQQLWEQALQKLELTLGEETVSTWLFPARVHKIVGRQITLRVPNLFYKNWLLSNYRDQIEQALREVVDENVDLNFIVAEADHADAAEPTAEQGDDENLPGSVVSQAGRPVMPPPLVSTGFRA